MRYLLYLTIFLFMLTMVQINKYRPSNSISNFCGSNFVDILCPHFQLESDNCPYWLNCGLRDYTMLHKCPVYFTLPDKVNVTVTQITMQFLGNRWISSTLLDPHKPTSKSNHRISRQNLLVNERNITHLQRKLLHEAVHQPQLPVQHACQLTEPSGQMLQQLHVLTPLQQSDILKTIFI